MDVLNRKTIELRRKLQSLDRELEYWTKRSEAAGPLEKHHTQVRRLATILKKLQAMTGNRLASLTAASGSPPSPESALTTCGSLELMILEVHRIWEFFRSKLVLREVEFFRDYLLMADELAWACYEPALNCAKARPSREPPLVFLNGSSIPFAMLRGHGIEAEYVQDADIHTPKFKKALEVLPIPIIGIPWFQVAFLPELLVVAHEVGHAVEDTFGLGTTLKNLIESAMTARSVPASRTTAWHAWRGELFADLWGNLAAGPAFAGMLADALAGGPSQGPTDWLAETNWNDYPPTTLRVLFSATVLEKIGFAAEAEALRVLWAKAYPSHALGPFEEDIPIVVDVLLGGPYPAFGDVRLDAVLSFSAAYQQNAQRAADQALRRQAIDVPNSRILAAAARLAFEQEPQKYVDGDAQARLIERVKKAQSGGVRGKPRSRDTQETKRIEEADREIAHELYAIFAPNQDDGTSGNRALS